MCANCTNVFYWKFQTLHIQNVTMQMNFEQIYHSRVRYMQKIPVERHQISQAETAREILYQDWNFSQILHMTVIYLFNYNEYTFVPWRMCLHKKGVSWTLNTIIFIRKHIFFMRMQQERGTSSKFGGKGYTRVKKANPKMQISRCRG